MVPIALSWTDYGSYGPHGPYWPFAGPIGALFEPPHVTASDLADKWASKIPWRCDVLRFGQTNHKCAPRGDNRDNRDNRDTKEGPMGFERER